MSNGRTSVPIYVWRACWDWQVHRFEAGDIAIGKPTTEMTANEHLAGQPCLIFTRNPDMLKVFLQSRPGGGILRLDLGLLQFEEWQTWAATGDIHVHAQAVLDYAEIIDPRDVDSHLEK